MSAPIWITIVVIALLISPMLRILPSKREKQQMNLRKKAMSLGMQVQLATLPTPRGAPPSDPRPGAAYRLNRGSDQREGFRNHITYIIGRSEGSTENWEWYNPVLQPDKNTVDKRLASLKNLPGNASIVESTPTTSAVYWQENGTDQDVEEIYKTLLALQQCETSERKNSAALAT